MATGRRVIFLLIMYSVLVIRHRHFFPTRRSSDLPRRGRMFPRAAKTELIMINPRYSYWKGQRGRSEEHTSELQSRLHIVCRLLLEKKKGALTYTDIAGDSIVSDNVPPLQRSLTDV